MYIKVKDHAGLVRDSESNAILNNSDKEYDQYMRLKNKALTEKQEIANLKEEVGELKGMMKLILEKLDK
jgi:CRISPR/Cas system-associated protein Cas7 (RAMP superfamily)|tara:strand:+ start:504 stop:710 length:207 start_codon:yes stop_codon:yes gene_type:complete